MDNSFGSISIIKEENNINKKDNFNTNLEITDKCDVLNPEKSLELSKIEVIDEQIKQKNKNVEDDIDELNDLSEYSFIKENNKNKPKKNKITKEQLNNIPLPIFSCIYCCDEKISFNHLSNEIISREYLFQTSIFDMKQLDILITGKRTTKINDNKLLNIVINNFENIQEFFDKKKTKIFFGSKKFVKKCKNFEINIKKKFRMKLEEKVNKKKKDFYFKEIKGMYKISKNSLNNKCLFNSNSIINNYSYLANLIPTGDLIQNFSDKKNNSLNSSHLSNLNIQGNSKSWKKNEIGLIGKDNNKHYVENIIEKIDKNIESDIFDFLGENDLKRKINRKDIDWEDNYFDINNPVIEDDILETKEEKEKNIFNYSYNIKNKNKNRSNSNIKFDNHQNINNSKHISINSENKSNIKISIFNNSKSMTSTNTSSNIIQKNKDNKSLSVFLNKNKIENDSVLSPRYNNIKIKDIRKAKKEKENGKELSPVAPKKRINDLDNKSYKKIFGNGNSCLDLKTIHKKILFNHTVNISKDKDNNEYKNMKETSKNIFLYKLNKNHILFNNENEVNKSYNKYKIVLNNNKINDTSNNSKTILDKMIKRFKSNKDTNKKHSTFNSVFKLNKNKAHIPKSPISNIKYSLITSHNNEKKLNFLNFYKKGLNIKNLDGEYINNFISPNLNKKENNHLERKFITENNKSENYNFNRKFNFLRNEIRIVS